MDQKHLSENYSVSLLSTAGNQRLLTRVNSEGGNRCSYKRRRPRGYNSLPTALVEKLELVSPFNKPQRLYYALVDLSFRAYIETPIAQSALRPRSNHATTLTVLNIQNQKNKTAKEVRAH